jgi:nucleotide-binding universal stress UspA family protein
VRVVAAIRFVEAAAVAEAAAGIARRLHQPLHLVHVLPAEAAQVPGDAARAFVKGALDALARRLGTDGLPVSVEVATGETHLELLAAVTRAPASLLVLGRPPPEAGRGRGGTVDRLSEECTVPMLAVPAAEPFASWGPGHPLRIAVGVDASPPTVAALTLVETLACAGPVELIAVRIVYPLYDCRRFGLPLPSDYQEIGPQLAAALGREVDAVIARARAASAATSVRFHPSLGRAADPLVEQAAEASADLLVIGTHHRRALGRLWSVSHHALRLARMAVATVPASGAAAEGVHAFRRVVAATDFSPLGDRAVALGRAALHAGGTLHLVHVAPAPPKAEEEAALLARLTSLVPDGADGIHVEAEVRVRHQPPGSDDAACILQTAERVRADLIAVGAGGRSTLLSGLLGSVATQVMAGAHLPVLIARPPE